MPRTTVWITEEQKNSLKKIAERLSLFPARGVGAKKHPCISKLFQKLGECDDTMFIEGLIKILQEELITQQKTGEE
jgi:hypothetical protein